MPASYPGALKTFTTKTGADVVASSHMNDAQLEIVAIETELGVDVAGSRTDLEDRLLQSLATDGDLNFTADTELTIATGAITIIQNWHNVDTEADAATDDLDTINGGADGYFLILRPNNTARAVVLRHDVGNIRCVGNANITLDDDHDIAILVYEGTLAKWLALGLNTQVSRDGWSDPQETWTFASASTFTVPGDQTATYTFGTKLKMTQTSAKYFHVLSSSYSAPNTTVTVIVQTDYTIANAAISANFYSRQDMPSGFPAQFVYTLVFTGFSADPAGALARFSLAGRVCTVSIRMPNSGTSNTTGFTVTIPITARTDAGMVWVGAMGAETDNGAFVTEGFYEVYSAGTTAIFYRSATVAWTASGGKRADVTIVYAV